MGTYEQNTAIADLIQLKDQSGETYSQEDKDFIARYEGKGGQGKKGARGEGLLYEFYTPQYIVNLMWKLAYHWGYDGGSILEPAFATGRFFKEVKDEKLMSGFEIDPTAFRIAEILYPQAQLFNNYFETAFLQAPRYTTKLSSKKLTWLQGYPFSLVIGNPPYGKHTNRYSSYFKTPKMAQMELFFIYHGLRLLKKGGLMVYITSSNILRNGISYNREKVEIGKLARLMDAYRLPPVFKSSAVPTDILILKRI
jgi:hypothetical protein